MHSSGKGLVSIPLDDKKLLDSFSLKDGNAAVDAKEFLFLLLRQRFVFDQYVIKRDYMNGGESWSLKRLVGYKNSNSYSPQYVSTFGGSVSDSDETPESRDVVMLQSMFNVSYTSQNYKYWLLGVLLFVEAGLPLSESLVSLAKAFAIRVYLRGECDLQNALLGVLTGEWHASGQCLTSANLANLDKGCAVENFIFNLYDYSLWCEKNENGRFTDRSSVEHFYPRHPAESDMLDRDAAEHQRIVDQFGNLCLISSSMNSSFGNGLPQEKAAFHENSSEGLSLKLSKMKEKSANWNKAKIDAETEDCKRVLSSWLTK